MTLLPFWDPEDGNVDAGRSADGRVRQSRHFVLGLVERVDLGHVSVDPPVDVVRAQNKKSSGLAGACIPGQDGELGELHLVQVDVGIAPCPRISVP